MIREINGLTKCTGGLMAVVLIGVGLACNRDKTNPNNALPPVETNPANTNYPPAFEGQTRVAAVTTHTAWTYRMIAQNLERPWGIAALPDNRLLITEKAGTMRLVDADGETQRVINGLPAVDAAGQGGLLGLAIDPAFETNRRLYWVFSAPSDNGNTTSVASGRLSEDEKSMEAVTIIYSATPAYQGTLHYGGRVVIDADGNLFVSTGERSDLVTRPLAQALDAALGKIVRINKQGLAVTGNPFMTNGEAKPELFSIGHRNPQGLAIHPVTGELWQAEHGPRGGDEINRILPGANYGWPVITYGIEYSGQPVGEAIQQKEGMTQPVYYWDPVVSPSGMTFYNGDRMPEWRNNLFIGALSGKHIVRLVIDGSRVVGEQRLLESENQRFRDVTQGSNGALYAITDEGRLYKIDQQL